VILREGALGFHRRHDGRLDQLGELEQVRARLGVQHALSDVNHGQPRGAECTGRGLDVARVGAGGRGPDGSVCVDQGVGDLLTREVGGNLDHRGPRTPGAHEADGPPHDIGDLAARIDRLDRLRDGGVRARRAEQREHGAGLGDAQGQQSMGVESENAVATPGRRSLPPPVLHAECGERTAVHARSHRRCRRPRALAAEHGRMSTAAGLDERRRR
jgi:hypothetical protein